MATLTASSTARRITASVRQRIEGGGERLWRLEDFRDLPFSAVAQALSRLSRNGALERVSKGIYYHGRSTAFGKSRPDPVAIRELATRYTPLFPAGIAAANLLGFSTQSAGRAEVSTNAASFPRTLLDKDTVIHMRRPATWTDLSQEDAALLDFLRGHAKTSELSADETLSKTLSLLARAGRYDRLFHVAHAEPPRVRAMLGALGERLGQNPKSLHRLKASLNPFSRFDFGLLSGMPNARNWQAKERRSHETV